MKRKGYAAKRSSSSMLGREVGRVHAEKIAEDITRPLEGMLTEVFRPRAKKSSAKPKA